MRRLTIWPDCRRSLLIGCAASLSVLALPSTAAPFPVANGTVVRVNLGPGGAQQPSGGIGNVADVYYPAISANGRYVAFTSGNPGLVSISAKCKAFAYKLGASQIYRRDLARGVTELVSVRPDGCPGSGGDVGSLSMSADGRYVAFIVPADPDGKDDIVPGFHPAGGADAVYVRDMVKHRTIAVSVGYDGRGNDADASDPALSSDGHYIAFDSLASNLVRHDSKPRGDHIWEVYLRDLRTGHTERIGPPNQQVPGGLPSISANGRYIALVSWDQELDGTPNYGHIIPDDHSGGGGQIYIFDRVTHRYTMASRSDTGISGNWDSEPGPSGQTISADGRYVVFMSDATNLVRGDDGDPTDLQPDLTEDVYLYDRIAHHLIRVSAGPGGIPGDYGSGWPAISADGHRIVFHSGANNLGDLDATVPVTDYAPTPLQFGYDIYLYDRLAGTNTLISKNATGIQGDWSSWSAVISGNGNTIAYISDADNLVSNDTNDQPDVFAWRQQ